MTKLLRFLLPWFHWGTFRQHSGPIPQGCVGSLPPQRKGLSPETWRKVLIASVANTTMVRR
jgi:hypothetical protein